MDDLKLHAVHVEDGAIDMSLSGDQAKVFMFSLIQFFEQNGGENFLTLNVQGQGKKYAITIQDCTKELTPADKLKELKEAQQLIPIDEWCEEDGNSLWWVLPVEEPPYCGSPLDCDFPDYVTHFTRLIMPKVDK